MPHRPPRPLPALLLLLASCALTCGEESEEKSLNRQAVKLKPIAASTAAEAHSVNPHADVLREAGITPDQAGIEQYLENLTPGADERRRIDGLIADLGHDDFSVRERAMATLDAMPRPPLDALQQAAGSNDYEVAWRAKKVIQTAGARGAQILYAALATIRHDAIAGLVEPVLAAIPHCTEDYVRTAALRALIATSRPDDAARLREALHGDDADVRRAAAGALCKVLGPSGAEEIAALLDAGDEGVRFEAAHALADRGDRRSLAALSDLLNAADIEIRAAAAGVLRASTGQAFGFAAYDPAEVRQARAERWRQWIDDAGADVELHFPLADGGAAELGRTLIALYNEHRVIEVDETGKQLREFKANGLKGPWGAIRLANGNLLINWFTSHTVIEYSPAGKEVWRKTGLNYPWSAERLENGNTLIACNDRVVEVAPDGKIGWQKELANHVADAHRLPNGNTLALVMDHGGPGRAIEVDPSGAVVWQLDGLAQPYRVQRLANGNTLITLKRSGVVAEYNRAKNIVWKIENLTSPDSAQRLASGRTLISDASGVREYDPGGRVVWEKKLSSDRSISWRY